MNKLDFYNIKTGDIINHSYLDMKNQWIVVRGYSPLTNNIKVKRVNNPSYELEMTPVDAKRIEFVKDGDTYEDKI